MLTITYNKVFIIVSVIINISLLVRDRVKCIKYKKKKININNVPC